MASVREQRDGVAPLPLGLVELTTGRRWPGALVVAAALALSTPARAQRGEAYLAQQPPSETPLSGFPGLFDTNTVDRHGVAASLPSTSVDVGITEQLTVGTYLGSMLPNAFGVRALALKARYRLYSDGRLTAVVDGLAGGASWDEQGEARRLTVLLAGLNVSYQLSRRNTLTAAFLGGAVSGPVDDMTLELSGAVVALSYQASFTPRLALELTALTAPVAAGTVESEFLLGSVRWKDDAESLFRRSFVRALLALRLGRWLLEGGGIAGAVVPTGVVPWFSVSKAW
jgi:hypothetical protein